MRRLLLAAVLASAAQAQAQSATLSLERLRLNDGLADGLVVATGDGLARGQVRLGLLLHFEKEPLVLLADGVRQGAVIDSRLSTHLVAAAGVTSWLMLSGELPVVVFQQGADFQALGVPKPASAGLGSPWLAARARLLTEGEGGLLAGSPVDLALSLGTALPVGSAAALASEAGPTVTPALSVGRRLGEVRLGGEAAVLVRTAKATVLGADVAAGTEALLGASASARLASLVLEASVRCAVPLSASGPVGVELLVGARGPVGPVELFVVGGPGLGKLPGTPSFRVLAGLTWTWSPSRAGDAAN